VSIGLIGADEFHILFCVGFSTASHLTKLKSLHVEREDESARACTQALYDTIIDVPALHFMLQPQNKWFERAIAIGMFTVPMALAVKDELSAKSGGENSIQNSIQNNIQTPKSDDGYDPTKPLSQIPIKKAYKGVV